MITFSRTNLQHEPLDFQLKKLQIKLLEKPTDIAQARELLNQYHYLKAPSKGRSLIQAVHDQGKWVAILDWSSAAFKIADRDDWIGWSPRQRAERRELIALNRRFLILSKQRMPNLASRCLALAAQNLQPHRMKRFGYPVLMAETFTDIERFAGTCYKAAGWKDLGETKGYAKTGDFYTSHDQPKKYWIRPLMANARRILSQIEIPDKYHLGLNTQSSERALPLKKPELDSLRAALSRVPDPRKSNRSYRLSSLLSLITMGLLAGCKNLSQIHRYGQFFNHQQRVWMDWPKKKDTMTRCTPSYRSLQNLLASIESDALSQVLSDWMSAYNGQLEDTLAMDGKYVRDQVLTMCLSSHENGSPQSVVVSQEHPRSQDNKRDGEITLAKKILSQSCLNNKTITADAMFANNSCAQAITQAQADYVLQIKDDSRHGVKYAKSLAEAPPF